ncbi:MAG: S8 family serine peptidase, partial [Pseudomonadota bacterium]
LYLSGSSSSGNKGGKGVVVGLVDGPIDVTHPTFDRDKDHAINKELAETTDPETWANSSAVINAEYHHYRDGRMAFSSKGGGHGTAMGGLIAGTSKKGICEIWGTAPEARLLPARVTNLVSDTHQNRLVVAKSIIQMAYGNKPAHVILVGPPFVRPDHDAYPKDWADNPTHSEDMPCDPLTLAILLVSLEVPVLIPSGNDGTSKISYPGAPEDFLGALKALSHANGREQVRNMLKSIGRDVTVADLEKISAAFEANADTLDPNAKDPFVGTGIIVVGSAKLSDPENPESKLKPAAYSQFGPGLFCLCPSDRDEDPGMEPDPYDEVPKFNYVPAPDIYGHGGYASSPEQLASHQGADYGFGGTSAATAQAAGVLARMIEARKAKDEPQAITGPAIRAALIEGLGHAYTHTHGYGLLTMQATLAKD